MAVGFGSLLESSSDQRWAHANLMKFNKARHQVLHLDGAILNTFLPPNFNLLVLLTKNDSGFAVFCLWDALTKSWAFLSLSKYHVGACGYVVLVQH